MFYVYFCFCSICINNIYFFIWFGLFLKYSFVIFFFYFSRECCGLCCWFKGWWFFWFGGIGNFYVMWIMCWLENVKG